MLQTFRLILKTVRYVGWSLFWLLIWDIIVTSYYMLFLDSRLSFPLMPLTLVGSALVVLISFRNSSAYNRWWEARTLWGALTNNSRSFAREVLMLVADGDGLNPLKTTLLRRHVAYTKSLAAQLRGQDCAAELAGLLAPGEYERRSQTNNFANNILQGSAALLAAEYRAGRLDSIGFARLESTMVELSNCQGGLERIANTPLPYPYTYFPALFISLFCLIVPVGLVDSMGWFTPLASSVAGFMLLVIERIGTDLQSPFQQSEHRIQTETLCANIEKNLDAMLRDAVLLDTGRRSVREGVPA